MALRGKRAHPETSMEIEDDESWWHSEITDQAKNAKEFYYKARKSRAPETSNLWSAANSESVVEIHQLSDRFRKGRRRARRLLRKTIAARSTSDKSTSVKLVGAKRGLATASSAARPISYRYDLPEGRISYS
jgi:hypothetical protein